MNGLREPNRKQTGFVFLVLGYVCVFALVLNIVTRMGWIHMHLPGLDGFGARWKWALAATVCFVVAWYSERSERDRPA